MDYLPVTLQLRGKKCLIVGGGEVALRKLKALLKAGALVDLISSKFAPHITQLLQDFDQVNQSNSSAGTPVTLIEKEFSSELLAGYHLVIAATDNRVVNRAVSVVARNQGILVNVVDSLELSSFIMPAIIDRSPLLVAVSTNGVSPLLARKIKEKIEWLIPKKISVLLKSLAELRIKLKFKKLNLNQRKAFYEWFIDASLNGMLTDKSHVLGDKTHVQKTGQMDYFDQYQAQTNNKSSKPFGKVFLVGAGPGDPELLTVKALKLLQKADVVLYDSLISDDILEMIRLDAMRVHVGKRANSHMTTQSEINRQLIKYARSGLIVVRLKGGDPLIFGRGGEELQALSEQKIPFEIVPGITAASGCASYAGIPLTHRDFSQSVRLVTAQQKASDQIDWVNLAIKKQTLVFYMGLLQNRTISESLIKNGLDSDTLVAIVENGTRENQRVITGRIVQLADLVEKNSIKMPALIIVGDVVGLSKQFAWYNIENSHHQESAGSTHPVSLAVMAS